MALRLMLLAPIIIMISLAASKGSLADEYSTTLQSSNDPNFVVNVWEEEFRQQSYADAAAAEKAYTNLLEKIHNYLMGLGISSQITTDYKHYAFGNSRLTILPHPQGPQTLNQVAYDLAQEGIVFQYWPKKYLFSPYQKENLILVRQASQRWYFNGSTIQNLSYMFGKNIFEQNIDIIRQQNADPLVARVFQDYLFGHKNYQSLSVDLQHPLPYFSLMLDEQQNIYIPYIKDRQQYAIPGTLAFNNYRAGKRLSFFAKDILRKLNRHDPGAMTDFFKLKGFYFGLLDNIARHIINLNAIVYLLIERPWNVFYRQDRTQSNKMCIYINTGTSRNGMNYFFNIPWPHAILENGNTSPLLASPEFQFFYRYHLDLFYRLVDLLQLAIDANNTNHLTFLQALIDLGDVSPREISATVQRNLWNINKLRYFMKKAQNTAINRVAKAKEHFEYFNQTRNQQLQNCAEKILPPDHTAKI